MRNTGDYRNNQNYPRAQRSSGFPRSEQKLRMQTYIAVNIETELEKQRLNGAPHRNDQ